MIIENLIRENIKSLKPYSSAREEFKNSASNLVYLDANENPFDTGLNRYPDPQQNLVKAALAKIKNVSREQLLLGNGSDEVLDLIFRVFCEPKVDTVIVLPPTYGMYEVLANTNDVKILNISLLDNYQPNVDEILKAQNSQTKLLFLCSPNNPTANSFNADKIETLIKKFTGIVIIDEAYIDFSSQESWIGRLNEFPNLIVIQTLSKAYGLAGIRLGACYSSTKIISVLNKIKPPYNVNQLTQQTALKALQNSIKTNNEIAIIISERNKLKTDLEEISFIMKVYPSDANFLLVKVDNAIVRYNQLVEYGIIVRNRTNQPICENCLRFTVGTKEENKKLMKTLKLL
ncbi:histidinol-phosphate transaminase [Flavobacteriaceae bacterium]|nr:histidinol-phosphate transaminase [Flavobacteriaceae bacterium]